LSNANAEHVLWHSDPDVLAGASAFHALYAEYEAQIDIRTLEIIEGSLPRRALTLVLEWAEEHRAELMEDWELCNRRLSPRKIEPLP
jgi:hypothetical protein